LSEMKPANIQVKTMRGNWTEFSAFHSVKSWLRLSTSQHEATAAVAAQNDAMAVGVKKAFEELAHEFGGRPHFLLLPYLGMDGVPTGGQAWVKSMVLAATVVAPPLAGTAVELLVRTLRTGNVVPEITVMDPYSFPALPAIKPHAERGMATAGRG